MSGRQRLMKTADLERRAWTLYVVHGRTQAQIAEELGVHQTTVGKALRRVEARHREDFAAIRVRERTHQLDRLDVLYAEAIASFERSKLARATNTRRTAVAGGCPADRSGSTTTIVSVIDSAGDPRFLNAALSALAERRKILGIEAPTQVAIADARRPDEHKSEAELELELLEALAALHIGLPKCTAN